MSFNASYRGTCSYCDGPIEPGREVEYTTRDDLVHVTCPEIVPEPVETPCAACFLVHAGECF